MELNLFNNKKILAIIPARAGSKRLPNKNLKTLNDKPLIQWTIEAAKNSKYLDKIILSTESQQIAQVAKNLGVEVPFLRPSQLAEDTSHPIDVVKHALNFFNEANEKYDYIVLLQPTSPFREAIDIDNAIELLDTKNADAIIGVCEAHHTPLWSNTLEDDLSMKDFIPKQYLNLRAQDLPNFYQINGAMYICDTKKIFEENTFYLKENIYAYIMPQERSVDIDTQLDFLLAQSILDHKADQ